MSHPDAPVSVDVVVKNWGDSVKPPVIKNSTVKTHIIDAVTAGAPRWILIAAYEPNRLRMNVTVIDSPVSLCKEQPSQSPDPSNGPGVAPVGAYMSPSPIGKDFFGPDAWWVNSLTGAAAGRVVVICEYAAQ